MTAASPVCFVANAGEHPLRQLLASYPFILMTKPFGSSVNLPLVWEGLLSLEEYQKLCSNFGKSDTDRMAVFQAVSRDPGRIGNVIFMPVAINPAAPDEVLAFFVFECPHGTAMHYDEVGPARIREWDLVRNDDWQPSHRHIAGEVSIVWKSKLW